MEERNSVVSGYTRLYMRNFKMLWKIHGLKSHRNFVGTVNSPTFPDTQSKLNWRLSLITALNRSNGQECLGVQIKLLKPMEENVKLDRKIKFEVSIIDDKLQKVIKKDGEHLFKNDSSFYFYEVIYKNELFDASKNLFHDEVLTICCIVSLEDQESCSIDGTSNEYQLRAREYRLEVCQDFEQLFENKQLADVTLVVEGRELPAHRAVLAARSPVFLAMFENDMREKQESRVVVENVGSQVFEDLLRFVYTGEVRGIENSAKELLVAADRYGVLRLKELCELFLCNEVTVDNVVDYLVLTDLYELKELKKKVRDFMIVNRSAVLELEEFKALRNSHPQLVIDVLFEMSQTNGNKQL